VTTLKSYLCGRWQAGGGEPAVLVNPATAQALAEVRSDGLDRAAALAHAREAGGPALRTLGFARRAELLDRMSKVLHERRDELLEIAIQNGGNTRSDAKFDVDGATSTLAAYARLGAALGDGQVLPDGEGTQLGRSPRFFGRHLLAPRHGVAVQINAFNFPAWGFAEKAACALLAGVPLLCKPATSTCLLAVRMFEILVEHGELPEGSIQLLSGAAGDLLDHLGPQDLLAFTGSADTGLELRGRRNLLQHSVRVNIEADSLNAAVLAPSFEEETYDLFLQDVVRELTQKAGQKCTAIRRILVPDDAVERVRADLLERLSQYVVGDPARPDVRVGPLATRRQLEDARAGLRRLSECATIVLGGPDPVEDLPEANRAGYFLRPTLLIAKDSRRADAVHQHEVFGPVATLLPYDGTAAGAGELVSRGHGCLVSSAYGDDRRWMREIVEALLPWNGRIYLGSAQAAGVAPGPGVALPDLVHGGPGRAGGGQELGGLRGLDFYMQRTAVQGFKGLLDRLSS